MQIPDLSEEIGHYWPEFYSQKDMICTNPVLERARIKEDCVFLKVSGNLADALSSLCDSIDADDSLKVLACFLHWVLFIRNRPWDVVLQSAPAPKTLGQNADLFLLVLLMRQLPYIQEDSKKRGVPPEMLGQLIKSANFFINDYFKKNDCWGIADSQWNVLVFSGCYYTVGNFGYIPCSVNGLFSAYRNISTGKVIALAGEGLEFSKSGLINFPDSSPRHETDVFISRMEENNTKITGNYISPNGHVLCEQICLDKKVWKRVVEPFDTLLGMHIPAERGEYTVEKCKKSYFMAIDFFEQYYPEMNWKAIWCDSWLFSPELQNIIGLSDSNIMKVQRQCYMVPISPDESGIANFVFHCDKIDTKTAPRSTALERGVVEILEHGGVFRNGGMFFLQEDLHDWGNMPYRNKD